MKQAQAFARKTKGKNFRKNTKKLFSPKCLCCKTGNFRRIAVFDQRGSASWYFGRSQNSSSCKS